MKKIIVFSITIMMLLCMSLTVFATRGSTEIDVKAESVYIADDTTYTDPANGGKATITTDDGIVITITGEIPDNLILVVKQVTPDEKEAYNWFSKVLEGKLTKICPFDIFFLKNGERVELSAAMNITITMPNGYTTPQMYSVDSTGKVILLDATVSDGKISFKTNHNNFYVLGNKASGAGNNPQTSGSTPIIPMSLAFGCLVAFAVFTRKRTSKVVKK